MLSSIFVTSEQVFIIQFLYPCSFRHRLRSIIDLLDYRDDTLSSRTDCRIASFSTVLHAAEVERLFYIFETTLNGSKLIIRYRSESLIFSFFETHFYLPISISVYTFYNGDRLHEAIDSSSGRRTATTSTATASLSTGSGICISTHTMGFWKSSPAAPPIRKKLLIRVRILFVFFLSSAIWRPRTIPLGGGHTRLQNGEQYINLTGK